MSDRATNNGHPFIDLVVLGSTGSFPGPDKPCSGYLFKGAEGNMLVDLGPGTMENLQKFHNIADIDALLITHLHPDHYSDLFVFAIYLEYFSARTKPFPLYGPKGSLERLSAMKWQNSTGIPEIFSFEELPSYGAVNIAGFDVNTCVNCHNEPAHSLRISQNGNGNQDSQAQTISITYTSDTALCDRVVELARNSDLLLAEATWLETPEPDVVGHMTPLDAANLAIRSESEDLVLTHLWPHLDPEEVRSIAELHLGRRVEIAIPGMQIRVTAKATDVTNIPA